MSSRNAGWLIGSGRVTFPPPPWQLGGDLVLSLWRLPKNLPLDLPSGFEPVGIRDHLLAATAFIRYRPGGVLTYDEFLTSVWLRRGADPRYVTVPAIWVNDKASEVGARALWGIPKQPGTFTFADQGHSHEASLRLDGVESASVSFRRRLRLPGIWTIGFRVAQPTAEGLRETKVRISGRFSLGQASWKFARPLTEIAHRGRQLLTFQMTEMSLRFG